LGLLPHATPVDASKVSIESLDLVNKFSLSIRFLAITMIFTNFGRIYGSIIMGMHRIDLVRIIDGVCTTIEAVIGLILLTQGYGILALVIALAVAELSRSSLYFILSRRMADCVRVRYPEASYVKLYSLLAAIRFSTIFKWDFTPLFLS